jgi:predicted N-acetyltransferase YhbS
MSEPMSEPTSEPTSESTSESMTEPISTSPSVIRLAQYTKSDLDEITGGVGDPFDVESAALTWRSKEEHFGVRLGGRLVAHAGLVLVPVSVGDTRTHVVGLGGVIVAPDVRGRGLARLAVTAAVEHARSRGPEHGLLFCWPDRVPVYQRMGWRTLEDDVDVEQPGGSVARMPLKCMWLPLREGAQWPSGPVRLLSLPM